MTQSTMMYNQPGMRPPNPFGSVSSAQVSAWCNWGHFHSWVAVVKVWDKKPGLSIVDWFVCSAFSVVACQDTTLWQPCVCCVSVDDVAPSPWRCWPQHWALLFSYWGEKRERISCHPILPFDSPCVFLLHFFSAFILSHFATISSIFLTNLLAPPPLYFFYFDYCWPLPLRLSSPLRPLVSSLFPAVVALCSL